MDDRIRDLMHRAIDGAATDDERERLRGILARDPAARSEWEELDALCRVLDDVQVDPPAQWKQELLEQLRERAARSEGVVKRSAEAVKQSAEAVKHSVGVVTRSAPGVEQPAKVVAGPSFAESWSRFVAALRRLCTPATGFAFVAGTAAGIALFTTFLSMPQTQVDGGSVPGTLLGDRSFDAGRPVGEARLDFGDARVHATTRAEGRLARVEIEVRSESRADLEVEFDPAVLHLRAFDQGDPRTGQVEVAAGRVRVQHLGRGRYWLWFAGTPEGALEIVIRVRSADQTLERSLPVLRDST